MCVCVSVRLQSDVVWVSKNLEKNKTVQFTLVEW